MVKQQQLDERVGSESVRRSPPGLAVKYYKAILINDYLLQLSRGSACCRASAGNPTTQTGKLKRISLNSCYVPLLGINQNNLFMFYDTLHHSAVEPRLLIGRRKASIKLLQQRRITTAVRVYARSDDPSFLQRRLIDDVDVFHGETFIYFSSVEGVSSVRGVCNVTARGKMEISSVWGKRI